MLNFLWTKSVGLSALTWKSARRVVILVVGMTVLLAGVVLLFLPGPGLLVMLAGLAIIAAEFPWARRLLRQLKFRTLTLCRTLGIPISRAARRARRTPG
jgi:uncharacterized protein (TIGR02611 family)